MRESTDPWEQSTDRCEQSTTTLLTLRAVYWLMRAVYRLIKNLVYQGSVKHLKPGGTVPPNRPFFKNGAGRTKGGPKNQENNVIFELVLYSDFDQLRAYVDHE